MLDFQNCPQRGVSDSYRIFLPALSVTCTDLCKNVLICKQILFPTFYCKSLHKVCPIFLSINYQTPQQSFCQKVNGNCGIWWYQNVLQKLFPNHHLAQTLLLTLIINAPKIWVGLIHKRLSTFLYVFLLTISTVKFNYVWWASFITVSLLHQLNKYQ